ncbi:MAG: DUF126 domain-containing protein [Candidatus Brockarchaeota archaeon]|nr:DUF126 domain-containing protein [Candidatus Brockarchaeota archaeon]
MKAKAIVGGRAEGESVCSPQPITFFGGVDPKTGEVVEEGHAIRGERIGGKVLVFPCGKGSTVGSYVLYALAKNGSGPAAIVNTSFDAIVATGCVVSGIPLLLAPGHFLKRVKTGDMIKVDGERGRIEVSRGKA